MANTAVTYPTSSSGWTSSNNANAVDGSFATDVTSRTFFSGDGSYEITPTANLQCTTYTGLASGLGSGDTINGITVEIRVQKSASPTVNGFIWLARGGVIIGSGKNVTGIPTSPGIYTFGSTSDLWGGSWTGANLGSIEVIFYAQQTTSTGSNTIGVDYINVTANYTPSTPNPFTFTDVTGAALSGLNNSNTITIAGLSGGASVPVTISGGADAKYSKNGGALTASAGTAVNGDTFLIQNRASASPATAVNATLTVGGTADTYTITTVAADTTPTAFSFGAQTGLEISTVSFASSGVTVAGINTSTTITISGASGQYRKNGGAYTSSAGTVVVGDYIEVKGSSSGSYSTLATVTVTIGGVVGYYDMTTRAADTTPAAFSFTDVTGAPLSTLTTSNIITITGIEAAANVSFVTSGGTVHEYSKNGGAWTAVGATTITNGQTLQVRMISPAGAGAGNITVTVGGVSDTYTVTTSVDTTPTQFTFTDVTSIPGILNTSNTITLAGMTAAVNVAATVSGGLMKVNAGAYVASANVVNGDQITLQATSSIIPGGVVNVVLTVETISDTYTITSRQTAQAMDF